MLLLPERQTAGNILDSIRVTSPKLRPDVERSRQRQRSPLRRQLPHTCRVSFRRCGFLMQALHSASYRKLTGDQPMRIAIITMMGCFLVFTLLSAPGGREFARSE